GLAALATLVLAALLAFAAVRRDEEAGPVTTSTGGSAGPPSATSGSAPTSGAGTTTSVVELSVVSKAAGPARIRDPDGIAYHLPAGWDIRTVKASNGFDVTLEAGDRVTAQVVSQRGSTKTLDELA